MQPSEKILGHINRACHPCKAFSAAGINGDTSVYGCIEELGRQRGLVPLCERAIFAYRRFVTRSQRLVVKYTVLASLVLIRLIRTLPVTSLLVSERGDLDVQKSRDLERVSVQDAFAIVRSHPLKNSPHQRFLCCLFDRMRARLVEGSILVRKVNNFSNARTAMRLPNRNGKANARQSIWRERRRVSRRLQEPWLHVGLPFVFVSHGHIVEMGISLWQTVGGIAWVAPPTTKTRWAADANRY